MTKRRSMSVMLSLTAMLEATYRGSQNHHHCRILGPGQHCGGMQSHLKRDGDVAGWLDQIGMLTRTMVCTSDRETSMNNEE